MTTQAQAYRMVRSAISAGKLARPSTCSECGATPKTTLDGRAAIQAHHHKGYDHPLEVTWLCAFCHRKHTPLPETIGGKALGEANGQSKLTSQAVIEIRASADRTTVLASRYGVSRWAIQKVRGNKQWLAAAPALVSEKEAE